MASIQDRLKLKRGSCDAWTIREQLCLASSVLKSGDQNWMSVSRSLKPFIEKELLRPPDWFSQKSCAMQYAHLLENTDTPKRKKRESGETTSESIVRKLKQERITELNQALIYHKNEYLRLKSDLNQLKSGAISDESLENMWHEMQQEERETEQKTRLHVAWLKRQQQQKQEMGSPSSSIPIANQTRKLVESTMDTTVQEPAVTEPSTENDDEKKSNRGGRSPLLTSLLKSPSPTTQTMQTFSSTSVQVSSPTITSLLGSSPKILNTQLTQNVSPQLQQLVSTAIASGNANVTSERPSVGAPTLSMLLEMPASAQRGPLPNLQTTNPAASIQQQQQQTAVTAATTITEVHNFQQTVQSQPKIQQTTIQNATTSTATAVTISAAATPALTTLVTAPTSIPVSENMVQIIDHIDDVIRKDIMTDVIDKDEINEIIGDIEELIKKEITHSPQSIDTNASTITTTTTTTTATTAATTTTTMTSTTTTAITTSTMTTTTTSMMTASATTVTTPTTTTATAAVIGGPAGTTQQTSEIPIIVQPKSEPRDVDEAVSLSDSPQSEMAIEEIDSSTSNIAEIIGTVAIEPQEPKIIVAEITEPVTNAEETKVEASICDEKTEDIAPQSETNNTKGSKNTSAEGKQPDAEVKSSNASAETAENDSKLLEKTKQTTKEIVMEEVKAVEEKEEEEGMEVVVSEDKKSSENVKEQKEPAEKTEGKNNARLDRVEMHLTKLTGDQQDVPSTEVVSVSSEVMNDVCSTDDTEKSQDISLVLENDENSQNSESKKKAVAEEQQVIENTTKSTESLESLKDESTVSAVKDKIIVKVKEELSVKSQEEETVEETLEIYTDEFKKEEIKDSSEDTASSILPQTEIKKEEIGSEAAEDITRAMTVEEVENDKSEPVDATATNTDVSIKKTEMPEPKLEPKAETEPEASGLFRGKSPVHGLGMEEEKKEKVEIKEEKEDVKKTIEQNEQSIKKEIETTVGEEPGELDEEESSLSKLSSARAMKTYSKRQNVAMDSEPETEGTGEGADYRAWKKAVMLVYNRLATHKYASVFLRPITEDQAPGYHSVIFRPMDLLTIKKNIDNGTIRSTMHFQRDVMLMFQNAIMYNKHDTFIYKMAVSMQEECLQHMQILVQVTGEGTFRRETRTATSSSSETSESILKRKRSHITPSPHDTDNPRSKKRRKSEND